MKIIELFIQYFPSFMSALLFTLELTAVSLLIASVIGIIFGLFSVSSNKVLKGITRVYVDIIRGTPLLVQAFLIYFGISQALSLRIPAMTAGVITLSINAGAYMTEIVRGGIEAVDQGQMEAASALGLSHFQAMRYVILPQAIRSVIPALGNSFVSLIKDSSLASVIATPELMYWANAANAQYYRVWETFITTAVIYLFLTLVTGRILGVLEKNH